MMTCLEFRRRVGAEPFAADPDIEGHRANAQPAPGTRTICAQWTTSSVARSRSIRRRALWIRLRSRPHPAPRAGGCSRSRRASSRAPRVGVVLLVSAPRASIAREVIGHVAHEPGAMNATAPLEPAVLAEILDPDGTRLRRGAGEVTFAARCEFDGHVVPHLVVRTPNGPVTVLMLRHRTIAEPLRIDREGYRGVVLPAPKGAIAIVGSGIADIDGVARTVFDAVDWGP